MKTITFDETKWRLVPVYPTDEMVDAGCAVHRCEQGDSWYWASDLSCSDCIDIYTEMLSAAPTPTDSEASEDIEALMKDAERLDYLERSNERMKMGWNVRKTLAGNVSVTSVIFLDCPVVSIRSAIDTAMAAGGEL